MNRLTKASFLFVVSVLFVSACGSAPESSSKRLDPNATSTTGLSKSPFARWVLDGWCAFGGGAISELLGKVTPYGGEPAEWYSEALNRTNPDERVALAGSRGDLERAKDEMDRQNLHYEPFEMDGVRGLAVPAPSKYDDDYLFVADPRIEGVLAVSSPSLSISEIKAMLVGISPVESISSLKGDECFA